jgi:hypothetical protein
VILLAAFGRSRDAFQGPIMQGLALVLANYGPDELDRDHLVSQLTKLPVRQIRARAAGLREMHKGAEPRLIGAVIVDQYNKAHAASGYRRAESFFLKVSVAAPVSRRRWVERPVSGSAHPMRPAEASGQPGENEAADGGLGGRRIDHQASSPSAASTSPPPPGLCQCGHFARNHDHDAGGDGYCGLCDECGGFRQAGAA